MHWADSVDAGIRTSIYLHGSREILKVKFASSLLLMVELQATGKIPLRNSEKVNFIVNR